MMCQIKNTCTNNHFFHFYFNLVLHSLYSCKLSLEKKIFLHPFQFDHRAFISILSSRLNVKNYVPYYIWEILFTCIHIHEQVIILIKLYIEPPEYLYVHVLYIQVTQINTSTTLCSSRKRIKYLCIFRYLNSGLTTCTESSYWKFKKWVHVIYHKKSSISKDVEEMLRVHGRDGGG